jgi:tRNA(fMet)-specific endonuclease VapC
LSGYLLDTNIISDIIRNPYGLAAGRAEQAGYREIYTSIIVAAELRYGSAKKGSPRLLAAIENILDTIPVLPLDVPADVEYGTLRAQLEAKGTIIGHNDLLIGAHARALKLTLVTDNIREFTRIPGLKLENWLEK